ncbi:MAG: hypothetical protein AB7F19_05070 [Candidatus Babeliales bacterium]
MVVKYIFLLLSLSICSLHAMEPKSEGQGILKVLTQAGIATAIECNSPKALEIALSARISAIQAVCQSKRDEAVQELLASQERNRSYVYRTKIGSIDKQFEAACKEFKNEEIPQYLKLAQHFAKQPPSTRSELFARGGTMLIAALAGTVKVICVDFSILDVALVPATLGCFYYGIHDMFAAQDYEAYLASEKDKKKKIKSGLRAAKVPRLNEQTNN